MNQNPVGTAYPYVHKADLILLSYSHPWRLIDEWDLTILILRFLLRRTPNETAKILLEVKRLEPAVQKIMTSIGKKRYIVFGDTSEYDCIVQELQTQVKLNVLPRNRGIDGYDWKRWLWLLEKMNYNGAIEWERQRPKPKTGDEDPTNSFFEPEQKTVQTRTIPRLCPRCSGTMSTSTDRYGTYASCIICGHSVDFD